MQDKIEKYEKVKRIGKELFSQSDVVRTGRVSPKDIEIAKEFLAKAITAVNPEVLSLYFEHLMIAPELGRKIAEAYKDKYSSSNVEKNNGSRQARTINIYEIEFLLWLHDLGRIVDPGGYLRNDIIDDNLLIEFGLPQNLVQNLPSVRTFLQVGKMLDLNEQQIQGKENLNSEQEKIASDYFNLLTPTQRIIFLSDNFGKRDEKGLLFSLETFLRYVRTEKNRYQGDKDWATDRMPDGEILSIYVIEKTIEWFKDLGVNFETTLSQLKNYGPKFTLVIRHGKLDNPKNLVYNRDEVMKSEDVIHLSQIGKDQLTKLGQTIEARKFRVKKIRHSPQTRAVESVEVLNKVLKIGDVEIELDLNEIFAPGAYYEGLDIRDWEITLKGNAYDRERWGKYDHEDQKKIIERMDNIFLKTKESLMVGESTILLSHGDPIAWWINFNLTRTVPDPTRLRNLVYPHKGEAIVVITDSQGKWFSYYFLQ